MEEEQNQGSRNDPNVTTNEWDKAIQAVKNHIEELKRSIQTFQELRDSGMEFPIRQTNATNKHETLPHFG